MKAKLNKHILVKADEGKYFLFKEDEKGFRIQVCKKLSKQNCDEIFGVVDVEKLFNEVDETIDFHEFCFTSFKLGFNKAIELNKDKNYTIEDLEIVYTMAVQGMERQKIWSHIVKKRTEIEVIIEMGCCGNYSPPCNINCEYGPKPKLDSAGCLILKKI